MDKATGLLVRALPLKAFETGHGSDSTNQWRSAIGKDIQIAIMSIFLKNLSLFSLLIIATRK
jgi:hypothetical protein